MKLCSDDIIQSLSQQAIRASRKRANYNFHPTLDDPIQRLLNAIEPGSYVRPHRHGEPGRWEWFQAVAGAAAVLVFEEAGRVVDRVEISPAGSAVGVEIPDNTWHTVVSLVSGTVLFEMKPGPYQQLADKDFAVWAPEYGDEACMRFKEWFRKAKRGDLPPGTLRG